MENDHPVILFDGVCNLCEGSVRFIIEKDREKKFRFAPLQSGAAGRLLKGFNLPTEDLETFVLIENGKCYFRSTAWLRALWKLGFPWSLFFIFVIVPTPIRDAAYNFVARNRHRWFGEKQSCMIPDAGIRERFLE